MTILSKLDELQKIADAATAGDWLVSNIVYATGEIDERQVAIEDGPIICTISDEDGSFAGNQAFIAISRTAVPQLIAALRVAVEALQFYHEFHGMEETSVETQSLKRIAELLEVRG